MKPRPRTKPSQVREADRRSWSELPGHSTRKTASGHFTRNQQCRYRRRGTHDRDRGRASEGILNPRTPAPQPAGLGPVLGPLAPPSPTAHVERELCSLQFHIIFLGINSKKEDLNFPMWPARLCMSLSLAPSAIPPPATSPPQPPHPGWAHGDSSLPSI